MIHHTVVLRFPPQVNKICVCSLEKLSGHIMSHRDPLHLFVSSPEVPLEQSGPLRNPLSHARLHLLDGSERLAEGEETVAQTLALKSRLGFLIFVNFNIGSSFPRTIANKILKTDPFEAALYQIRFFVNNRTLYGSNRRHIRSCGGDAEDEATLARPTTLSLSLFLCSQNICVINC